MLMLGSSATGNVNLCAVTNGATSLESASTDTATSVKPTLPVLAVQPLHRGHLLQARRAPGRPEVDQHDLPAVVEEPDLAAARGVQREVLGALGTRRLDELELADGVGQRQHPPGAGLGAGATVAFAGADAETWRRARDRAASPRGRCSPANSPTAAATATRVSAITMASSGRIESCAVYL